MTQTISFIGTLHAAADSAAVTEATFRREAGERIAALECERVFAFRRLNLMRAVADGVAAAGDEEIAAATGIGILRSRLDWADGSETQLAILSRFAPVARALFASLAECAKPDTSGAAQALAEFEAWYEHTYRTPFWVLLEQHMEETPRVDF
jgi:hypothetical protein